jgi:hypothetical protein
MDPRYRVQAVGEAIGVLGQGGGVVLPVVLPELLGSPGTSMQQPLLGHIVVTGNYVIGHLQATEDLQHLYMILGLEVLGKIWRI